MKFRDEAERRRYEEDYKPAYDALMSCYPFGLDDLLGERWLPIPTFDKYYVSTFGRVKSFKWTKPRIMRPTLHSNGYLFLRLCKNAKHKNFYVHILVAKMFIPNPEGKPEVNHDDGRKMNCYVGNLYWSTRAENQQHAVKTGLLINPKGTDSYGAKIKDEADIIYIRENPDNLTQQQLAAMFGVSDTSIGDIQLGKSYQNAGGNIREKIIGTRPRISEEIRAAILADWATGLYTKSQLARKFGYSHTTIRRIIREG